MISLITDVVEKLRSKSGEKSYTEFILIGLSLSTAGDAALALQRSYSSLFLLGKLLKSNTIILEICAVA